MRSILARKHLDLSLAALIIIAFSIIAAQRLGTVPVPETDEAYILQIGYEITYRNQISWPMYRYLGGDIENNWHTFTPLYFLLLGGFFKVAGWGLAEGRAFHLFFSALVLLMTYLIGRRMFNYRVGLAAILMLAADQTFFERSRLIRYEPVAMFFALAAFYLYERAEETKQGREFAIAGLLAGASVLCHPNMLYMFGGIGLLMILRNGWQVIKRKRFYQYALPALTLMAYVIIKDLLDYQNFLLQNREDKLHFRVFEAGGIIENLIDEARRYEIWLGGGEMFLNVPRATLLIFQLLSAAALVYLIARAARYLRRGAAMEEPAFRLLIITLAAILFHALITSHKQIYYMAYITPWLALAVGVMLADAFNLVNRLRDSRWLRAGLIHRIAVAFVAIAVIAFTLQMARQYRRYVREARNPDLARFDEVKTVLRNVVPPGVCPVAIKSPVMWLAFPEYDRCFASIENRMKDALDLKGNEYAILVPAPYDRARAGWTEEFDAMYPLIGELHDTVYGTIRVYYTGAAPEYLALETKTYHFLGERRGYVSKESLAQSREVWSVGASEIAAAMSAKTSTDQSSLLISPPKSTAPLDLCSIDLKPQTFYQLAAETSAEANRWQLLVLDRETSAVIQQIPLGQTANLQIEGLFKTMDSGKIRLAAQHFGKNSSDLLRVMRFSVREVAAN